MKTSPVDPNRSAIMRSVKSEDTGPEVQVRRYIHRLGYRFRLHKKSLPGTPDIVLARLKKAVLVNGCFWHGHTCRRGNRIPHHNRKYWTKKISGNRKRDKENQQKLRAEGWKTFVVWECQVRDDRAMERLRNFLSGEG